LAERRSDILLLAKAFLEKAARKLAKDVRGIEPNASALLTSYSWPGNVRELENVIERAVLLAGSNAITVKELMGLTSTGGGTLQAGPDVHSTLAEVEKAHIKRCLEALSWNVGEVADRLGIHRNTLRLKIKEYQITKD
jgi:DNA-binding NtrC family response regulator